MSLTRPRYQLWQIMTAIAVFAGLFAAFGVIGTIAILIVISVLTVPVILAGRGRRLRAAAWVASLYPMLLLSSLYTTWFTAWAILGHRPRMSLDDPKIMRSIAHVPHAVTFFVIVGFPEAAVACVVLVVALVTQGVRRDGVRPVRIAVQLLIPVISWLTPYLISRSGIIESAHIFEWYMD